VGKTTAAHYYLDGPHTHFVSADLPMTPTAIFIEEQWQKARAIPSPQRTLVLDEIQKIPRWSEVVKKLYDEDRAQDFP
jgi:predicted AAA+ superfamily ATPase